MRDAGRFIGHLTYRWCRCTKVAMRLVDLGDVGVWKKVGMAVRLTQLPLPLAFTDCLEDCLESFWFLGSPKSSLTRRSAITTRGSFKPFPWLRLFE